MKIKLLLSIAISVFSFQTFACVHQDGSGFLPKNDMYIPDYAGKSIGAGGITESDFNDVINKVENMYGPIVRGYGGTLQIKRLWSDGTVNARASRQPGSVFLVEMFGGLARHDSITKDAFALVACHEVGHHIGGVPRYSGDPGMSWASTEGQSDYFATTKCLRKIFSSDNNESIIKNMNIDPLVTSKCESEFSVPNDIAMCKRISMAGFSSSSMFAVMSNRSLPKFDTPDQSVVQQTYESHPQYQCRLDTYFNGANCEVQEDVEIGQSDANVGTCNRKDKFTEGLRPLCWFKPSHSDPGDPGDPNPPVGGAAKTPTSNGQTSVSLSDPNATVPMYTDVSGFSGVKYVGIEFSHVNKQFSNPNSTAPDKANGMRVEVYPNITGTYNLIPMRHLPEGWGTYQIRVIGLDAQKKPVSKNSNAFLVNMRR